MADIKFSEFQKANQSKDSDEIAILQDGVNKMIPSPVLESKIINKTVSRVIDQGGASLNLINLIGVVPTYADLALITPTPELNDAYQVEADGLVYVYTENGFQSDGGGFNVQSEPNGVIEEGNSMAVSGGAVYEFISGLPTKEDVEVKNDAESIGVEVIPAGTNFAEILANSNFSDEEEWGVGSFRAEGNIVNQVSRHYTKKYHPIPKGEYVSNMYNSGVAVSLLYNADGSIHTVFANTGSTDAMTNFDLSVPEDGMSLRFSKPDAYEDVEYFVKSKQAVYLPTSQVFVKTDDLSTLIKDEVGEVVTKEDIGINVIPEGTNVMPILDPIDFFNEDIWAVGFLRADGSPNSQTGWRHTKQFYPIDKGVYNSTASVAGSAVNILYNEDGSIHTVFSDTGSPYQINVPFDNMKIRLSQALTSNGLNRYISTAEDMNKATDEVFVTRKYVDTLAKSGYVDILKASLEPKSTPHVVCFIADDGPATDLEWYVPIFRERKCFATLAIIGNRIDSAPSRLTSEEIKDLYKEGFDIANHTYLHERDLTEDEYDKSVYDGRLVLNKLGIDCPVIISPFGEGGFRLKIFKKYHSCNFVSIGSASTGIDIVNLPPINTFALKRVSFDAVENGVSTLERCKEAVDAVLEYGGLLAFATHTAYPEYSPSGNPDGYLQRRAELGELLDYIQGLNIPILTAKAAFDFYKNPIDIGIRNTSGEPYYSLGMDGSEAGNYFD